MKIKKFRLFIALIALVSLSIFPFTQTQAAGLTSISDTLTTLTQNTVANHTILFVTPTGVDASTDTITIDLTDLGIGSVAFGDIDLAYDTDGTCTTFSTEKTLAATPGLSPTWGAAIATSVLTFTPPTDSASGEIIAGRCVQVQIGTNAAGGVNQLTNPNDTNTHVFEIGGVFGDSGSFAVDFLADDSVNITSTVDPTLSFSLSDTTIGFGTLDSGNDRWATGDTLGTLTPGAAHTFDIGTNATNGYSVTYNGATLTSGSDTISVATWTGDPDGTPGTEQFAIGASTAGDGTVTTAYDQPSNNFSFVASTATEFFSELGPTATETVSMYYVANISANTEAGSYSTDVTYIATATF